MKHSLHALFDRLFRDKDGQVVIAQAPNLPIIGWLVFLVLGLLLKHGHAHTGLHLLSQAFLFVWAYKEIESGASLFRRILGGLVMAGLLASFFLSA